MSTSSEWHKSRLINSKDTPGHAKHRQAKIKTIKQKWDSIVACCALLPRIMCLRVQYPAAVFHMWHVEANCELKWWQSKSRFRSLYVDLITFALDIHSPTHAMKSVRRWLALVSSRALMQCAQRAVEA